jgi:hypothetical protein
MLAGTFTKKEFFVEERISSPERFPYCAIVTVGATAVTVYQEFANEEQLKSARAFVVWMRETYQCRFEDEYGRDMTNVVNEEGVDALFRGRRLAPLQSSTIAGETLSISDAVCPRLTNNIDLMHLWVTWLLEQGFPRSGQRDSRGVLKCKCASARRVTAVAVAVTTETFRPQLQCVDR